MSGNIHPFKIDERPQLPSFVETTTARAILRAMRRARAKEKLTLIAGAPGIGKTKALHHFHREVPEMMIHTAVSGEGGVYNLACALSELVGLRRPATTDLVDARHRLAQAIGVGGFVAIDEAQYLVQRNPKGRDDTSALEWMRALSEEGFFGLALIGDMSLVYAVADLPQLNRRTHPRVVVEICDGSDIADYCAAHGLKDRKLIDKLASKAKRFGGLGYAAEIFADARDLCGGSDMASDHFHAAMQLFEEGCR